MAATAGRPVVLQLDVPCSYSCVRKIRGAISNMYGVERVWASPLDGLVVVHGTADAYALIRRIRRRMRRRVTIVSGGSAPHYYDPCRTHYGPLPPPPPPPAGSYPYAAGGYGAGCADPDPYCYAQHSTEPPACSISCEL